MIKWRQHYWAILAAQIFLLFVAAMMEHHIILSMLFVVALFGVFGSVISAIWGSSLPRMLAIAVAIVAIVSGMPSLAPGASEGLVKTGLTVCCFSYSAFILIAIIAIARHVFVTDRVTANRIVGSICLYMLIGMFYAFLYAGMSLMHSGMFAVNVSTAAGTMVGLRDFLYFSYSTLTTTGYGDIVPTHAISRTIACLEGMSGAIYLAIMVARLVGMHVTQAHSQQSHHS